MSAPIVPTTDTVATEIADGVFRISTLMPDLGPGGFTFNQFLLLADEPLLFHTGFRGTFPLVAEAVSGVVPVERVRWISFGHVEADECAAMNMWLAAAPDAEVTFGALGCAVSIDDLADRPPRPLADGEVLDLGGKRVRQISTPHVPHGWEAQVLFEEVTGTLLCGDLFSQFGADAVTSDDVAATAIRDERAMPSSSLAPNTVPVLRALADLAPTTLALMHGPSFQGDGGAALHRLADGYGELIAEAAGAGTATSG